MATAFLFDMDGTLLDSEPSHFAAWRKAVEETGSDNSFLTDEVRSLSILYGADCEQKKNTFLHTLSQVPVTQHSRQLAAKRR